MQTSIYHEEHEAFRRSVRTFLAKEVVPYFSDWEAAGCVPHEVYQKLGDLGMLGLRVPAEYGGGGDDGFLYSSVWSEECSRAGVSLGGAATHMNLVIPYILRQGTEEQKRRWLPDMVAGRRMGAIAMTEPGTGSDLAGIRTTARLEDGHWVLSGGKTFISGGINADLVIVVARTSENADRRAGLSLLVVDADSEGFSRGRNLEKIGLRATDTAELFFDEVAVPADHLLGEEGQAFRYLAHNLVQERLGIALGAQVSAEKALRITVSYVKDRTAFGRPVSSFQNTKFKLASCHVEVTAGRALLDRAMRAHEAGELTAAEASTVKVYCTETQNRVIDRCLQLHGGYGFMREYEIARMYTDARVSRIYGGTNEVQRVIIARALGL
ncbi:acyl-CoA dehydrogenase family protein [Actinomadura rugatobispora]|uniref:Acyl-CoA dehydrogenase family protein n=1 Tax=Actinomadura rugatobispora TaxID=1994 RepID=A0ABW0ZY68_9ACTN|nr:acyl-CoA dehydrogenase family protein [Actinomadura rugatobispora]